MSSAPTTSNKLSKVRVAIDHAGSFIGKMIGGVARSFFYWKESTIFLPLAIILMALICLAVILVTGRQLLNDIGVLVDDGITFLRIAIICALVGWFQKSLFGYRAESHGDDDKKYPLCDDIHDSAVTAFLLLLFSVLVFWF